MKDRNVQHASRFRLTKVTGTDDVYDLIPAPGEVYEEGTLINKSALLKDSTAALFGLGDDAVPDDVLQVLSRFQKGLGNEYVWEKTQEHLIYYEVRGEAAQTLLYSSGKGTCGKSIEINQTDGSVTITDLLADTPFTSTYEAYWKNKPPFYCMYDNQLMYVAGPYANGGTAGLRFNGVAPVSIMSRIGEESFGYVNSPDPNAYPIDDGYTYIAFGQLGDKVRIATGSYVGTGTYGASNPCSLTFDFVPSIIWIYQYPTSGNTYGEVETNFGFIFPKSPISTSAHAMVSSRIYINGGSSYRSSYLYSTLNTDTISWWNGKSASEQMNSSNINYNYIALG